MKFELKTQNEIYSKSFSLFSLIVTVFTLIFILCDVAFKVRIISRHYDINYYCRLLSVEKSTNTFKNLSRLSNLKSKQRIWEFCREVIK